MANPRFNSERKQPRPDKRNVRLLGDDIMRNALMIVSLIIFLAAYSTATEIPKPEAVTFLGTERSAAQLKKAVFAVQLEGNTQNKDKNDDWILIGSGFFVKGTNSVVLGVTCKHVVAPAINAKKNIFIGLEAEQGYRRAVCKIPYIDPDHDIAILAPQRSTDEDIQFQNLTFPEDIFDDNTSLVEGRGVIIPGYPLGLGVEEDANYPVIRIGIIAQYTGKKHFLIDGIASHGNSGSPVFTQKAKNEKLIGMITSHVADKITLFDENGQLTAQFPYNSGLARAITIINPANKYRKIYLSMV
jgi:hypothetical protein